MGSPANVLSSKFSLPIPLRAPFQLLSCPVFLHYLTFSIILGCSVFYDLDSFEEYRTATLLPIPLSEFVWCLLWLNPGCAFLTRYQKPESEAALRASSYQEENGISVLVSGHMNSPLVGFLSCIVTTFPFVIIRYLGNGSWKPHDYPVIMTLSLGLASTDASCLKQLWWRRLPSGDF